MCKVPRDIAPRVGSSRWFPGEFKRSMNRCRSDTLERWIGADGKVQAPLGGLWVGGFYVHPKSRLLCFTQRPSARERKKRCLLQQEIDEIRFDCSRSFKLIGGQWYFVVYQIVEMSRYEPVRVMWDVILWPRRT